MSLIFILLGTFFLLAFLGVPIAISLGVASGIGMLTAGVSVSGIAQRMFAGVDSFSYLAIPMFMLAGKLMDTAAYPPESFKWQRFFAPRSGAV